MTLDKNQQAKGGAANDERDVYARSSARHDDTG